MIENQTVQENTCPISKTEGVIRRQLSGTQLFDLYGKYFDKPIDKNYFNIDPNQIITEYYSQDSGLIWYSPCILGDGDYYDHLSKVYPGYYNAESWDKKKCHDTLLDLKPDWVIEVGSGDGWLLSKLKLSGLNAYGVELNEKAISECRNQGLKVYGVDEEFTLPSGNGALCLLQTIEHLHDPLNLLTQYINRFQPKHLILSAPCFETLLGHTCDPLSWPPHHATSWSEKSMRYIGKHINFELDSLSYSPLSFQEFSWKSKKEISRKFFELPKIPQGLIGRLLFEISRLKKNYWCVRGHSIFCCLSKRNTDSSNHSNL